MLPRLLRFGSPKKLIIQVGEARSKHAIGDM
jgi:hypothetical protein